MNTNIFTIESVHGIKQTFIVGTQNSAAEKDPNDSQVESLSGTTPVKSAKKPGQPK